MALHFHLLAKANSTLLKNLGLRNIKLDKEYLNREKQKAAYGFVKAFVDVKLHYTLADDFHSVFLRNSQSGSYFNAIVNIQKINDIRYINKFFEGVNGKLKIGDIFISCVETYAAHKHNKKISRVPIAGTLYFGFEFIFLRVFPKLWGFKKVYFLLTRGRNRLLSKAEAFGRLASCGFEIVDYESFGGLMYVVSKKMTEPVFNMNPSYGPIYKMPRLGKNGQIIGVYKFRTMHPYAEYLQDYILKVHGYADTGKPANDFRLTPWGKFLRKYWLDELPQLINLIKGEMKLVGVRPVGTRYAEDIPKDLLALRFTQKPGCIPPYVSLNMRGNVDEVLEAERKYLMEKLKHPHMTDTKYFFNAVSNIIFKRKRSA